MPLRKTRTSVLVLHTLQQGGIAHLAAGYISRTPYLLLLVNSIFRAYPNNPLYPQGKLDACVVGEKRFSTQLDM